MMRRRTRRGAGRRNWKTGTASFRSSSSSSLCCPVIRCLVRSVTLSTVRVRCMPDETCSSFLLSTASYCCRRTRRRSGRAPTLPPPHYPSRRTCPVCGRGGAGVGAVPKGRGGGCCAVHVRVLLSMRAQSLRPSNRRQLARREWLKCIRGSLHSPTRADCSPTATLCSSTAFCPQPPTSPRPHSHRRVFAVSELLGDEPDTTDTAQPQCVAPVLRLPAQPDFTQLSPIGCVSKCELLLVQPSPAAAIRCLAPILCTSARPKRCCCSTSRSKGGGQLCGLEDQSSSSHHHHPAVPSHHVLPLGRRRQRRFPSHHRQPRPPHSTRTSQAHLVASAC
ncbi:hypothetical protein BLNAU_15388 [Blattamonas nauphoetae]|uniref:Uncharacterized protein n=1 Tax=Blattamonas nauphoetae TaxID=2049346 RepID=A0ABQ9XE90_9EUKA|nr:hypothetical protein BLNAU_15388 [Blattamonas nauphoetae]